MRQGGRYIKDEGEEPRLVERTVPPGETPIAAEPPSSGTRAERAVVKDDAPPKKGASRGERASGTTRGERASGTTRGERASGTTPADVKTKES